MPASRASRPSPPARSRRGGAAPRWEEHALQALRSAGFRAGGARSRVVHLLAGEECAVTALEIDRRLEGVGRASVYRALEQLESLGLVERVEVGGDAASFERREPHGEHHHHLVCDRCGALLPFSDDALEQAIQRISRRSGFAGGHDVVIRGSCARCREGRRDA